MDGMFACAMLRQTRRVGKTAVGALARLTCRRRRRAKNGETDQTAFGAGQAVDVESVRVGRSRPHGGPTVEDPWAQGVRKSRVDGAAREERSARKPCPKRVVKACLAEVGSGESVCIVEETSAVKTTTGACRT
mmetsp:Transcript_35093/g.113610  ORF Transcript_35093/g.113610 Transcript_35093/m.113610 type:complete len:133 (+) Transcript_35093:139-537(+)